MGVGGRFIALEILKNTPKRIHSSGILFPLPLQMTLSLRHLIVESSVFALLVICKGSNWRRVEVWRPLNLYGPQSSHL